MNTTKTTDSGVLTLAMSNRSIAGSEDFVQVDAPETPTPVETPAKPTSPIAKTINSLGKKIWAHRSK